MTAWVKVGGAWKTLTPRVKISGTWRALNGGFVKVAGVWRRFYGSAGPPTITLAGRTFTTAAGNKAVAVTPTSGDLLVAVVASCAQTNLSVTDNQFGTYTQVATALKASSNDRLSIFVRDAFPTVPDQVHTVTASISAGDGGGIAVFILKNMPVAGNAVVRQAGSHNNIAAATTPAPVLSPAGVPLSTGVIVGAWFGGATVTISPRAGYTEHYDETFSTPAAAWEAMTRIGGETSSTISWGGNPGTGIHCACAVELFAE